MRHLLPAILALAACAEPPTAILVRIEVDDAIADDVEELSLVVESGGESLFTQARPFSGRAETISLRPGEKADDIALALSASAILTDGSAITTRATTRFVSGRDRDVCLFIDGRCEGLDCGADGCRAAGCEPLAEAPAACEPPRCGESSTCDDGLSSTIDSCGEDGACVHDLDPDADGDGFDATSAGGEDCDDEDPDAHPGAEDPCDGKDQNCDLVIDGEVLASRETGWSGLVRVLVTREAVIVAWNNFTVLGGSSVVVARRDGDELVTADEYEDAAWPALAPFEGGVVLSYFDLTSARYRLARLAEDGERVEWFDWELADIPDCGERYRTERPTIASSGPLVAVAYHDCDRGDPDNPGPKIAVANLDGPQVVPPAPHAVDDGFVMFPSIAPFAPGFAAVWGRVLGGDGWLAATVIPESGVPDPTIRFDLQGVGSPAALASPVGLAVVYLEYETKKLRAWDLRDAEEPTSIEPEDPAKQREYEMAFPGTQSDAGAAALAYVTAGDPAQDRSVRPELVLIVGIEERVLKVLPILDSSLGSSMGDVTVGPIPERLVYYADSVGPVGTKESRIILARMSCAAH